MMSVLAKLPARLRSSESPTPRADAEPALPALRALSVQFLAAVATLVVAVAWARFGAELPPPWIWVLLQGVVAAALSWRIGMARWWIPIHLLFAPALFVVHSANLAPIWFLAGFALLWLVHGATYRTQVPTHLSKRAVIAELAGLLPSGPHFRVLDLGCGFGGVLSALARIRPEGCYEGIEAALLPFLVSWLRAGASDDWIRVAWGDFWEADWRDYDVVYAYLSPAAMPRLWAKAQKEMKPGSLLVSNSFIIPGVAPMRTIATQGGSLYLWRIGEPLC